MTVLILPGFRPLDRLPNLGRLAEQGRVRRLAPVQGLPEAAYLGLPPTQVADGPLIVAALGHEPPERSIQFHLSLLGMVDGTIVASPPPSATEAATVAALLPKLNTKRLTTLAGPGPDHALVMEEYWDLGTTPRDEAIGKPYRSVLPEGEAEEELRRFIDDSVNMLSELEFNRRRADEEKPPLNLLWPWGHGAPRRFPNLALRRGAPAVVETSSLRLQGLARLVGYRPFSLASGLETDWEALARRLHDRAASFVVYDTFDGLGEEETDWLTHQIDRRLFSDFGDGQLLLAAPTKEGGLLLEIAEEVKSSGIPFHPEIEDDRSIPRVDLWEAIDSF